MTFEDLFAFQNPQIVAVALGVLAFILIYYASERIFKHTGASVLIGGVFGLYLVYRYYDDMSGTAINLFKTLLILIPVFIVIRIFLGYRKHKKRKR